MISYDRFLNCNLYSSKRCYIFLYDTKARHLTKINKELAKIKKEDTSILDKMLKLENYLDKLDLKLVEYANSRKYRHFKITDK